jgi:hypothetical protein
MKKYIIPFLIFCLCFAAIDAQAQNKVRAYTALTGGGTGALDKTATAELADKDIAMVVTATDLYFYSFVAAATDAESSPLVIRPNDYSAAGVWKLVSFNALAYRASGTESFLTLVTQASRAPTAASYELYVEGGYLRYNDNGTEKTLSPQDEIHVTVVKPQDMADAVRDMCVIWSNESGKTFKITGWKAWAGTDNTTLTLKTMTASGGSIVTVDAVEIATDGTSIYYAADTTITSADIADGNLLFIDFDDADDPAYVKLTIYGYYY